MSFFHSFNDWAINKYDFLCAVFICLDCFQVFIFVAFEYEFLCACNKAFGCTLLHTLIVALAFPKCKCFFKKYKNKIAQKCIKGFYPESEFSIFL